MNILTDNLLMQFFFYIDVLIFFKKKFCLMSDLNFTLSDVTSFLPDNLSGLEITIFRSEENT